MRQKHKSNYVPALHLKSLYQISRMLLITGSELSTEQPVKPLCVFERVLYCHVHRCSCVCVCRWPVSNQGAHSPTNENPDEYRRKLNILFTPAALYAIPQGEKQPRKILLSFCASEEMELKNTVLYRIKLTRNFKILTPIVSDDRRVIYVRKGNISNQQETQNQSLIPLRPIKLRILNQSEYKFKSLP